MRIVKPQFVGNFANGIFGAEKKILRFFHYVFIDVILWRTSRFFLDEVTEIMLGKIGI